MPPGSAKPWPRRWIEHGEFITVQDLHRKMCDAIPRCGRVQHYRVRTTAEHQHYLLCRSCGTSVPITSETIERWAADTARELGFAEVAHVIELSGIYAACRSSTEPNG